MDIRIARSLPEIDACYPAFSELRPHLSAEAFSDQVQRQMQAHGYVLVSLADQDRVLAAAGYRVVEYLAWGRIFYLDDLVTLTEARQRGYGSRLLDWLIAQARELECEQFHLDSGVQRFAAHRLYMSRKFHISSHHFSLKLGDR